MEKKKKHLRLRSPAIAYIDWANVHGWEKTLKREVDIRKVFRYLRSYKEVREIRFYFGTDKHPKSKGFLNKVKKIGYSVTTKLVKYILVAEIQGKRIYKRKCDFDIEICIDVHKDLEKKVQSFIFFTGDGDFEPLYRLLISKKKQMIAVYAKGHIGREIWEIERGLFKIQIGHLGL